MPKHYAEGLRIHCDGPDGNDYTLCGYALEGEDGSSHLETTAASINCDACIRIIEFCRRIRSGELEAPFLRRARRL